MASYDDPDAWIDTRKIPWGGTDYDNPDPAKVETLHHSWWANNRAANGAWDAAKGIASTLSGVVTTLAGVTTELVRIRTYVGRIETKVDALAAKIDSQSKPPA